MTGVQTCALPISALEPEASVAVAIDAGELQSSREYLLRVARRKLRDAALAEMGYRVIHVTNRDVMVNMDGVLRFVAEELRQIDSRIRHLMKRMAIAEVIDPSHHKGQRVTFGCIVTVEDEQGRLIKYQIVGQPEADAKTGKISYNSPLGRALIGRKVEEEVEVTVPSGDRFYVVEKIEFI